MRFSNIINMLSIVEGIGAIALGGSRSTGKTSPDSDFDIGVYYYPEELDVTALSKVLTALDEDGRDKLLNPPGAWGSWINGGGWITVAGVPVDILLRDMVQVEKVLRDCIEGLVTIDYQSGHPFGFVNTIYVAETHFANSLWQDRSTPLDRLKLLLKKHGEYPPKMKEAVIKKFMWEAWFSLECTRKAALRGDVNYTVGSVFRTACSWAQVIYALNDEYLMNEKGAYLNIDGFERVPDTMQSRIESAYTLICQHEGEKALEVLDALQHEMRELTRDYEEISMRIR